MDTDEFVIGTVRFWYLDHGWGVIDTPQVADGVWAHFSAIHASGPAILHAGETVHLTWERADQDGFSARAVVIRRTEGDSPLNVLENPSVGR